MKANFSVAIYSQNHPPTKRTDYVLGKISK